MARRSSTSSPSRTRALGYIRVSTDKQADHGVSLEAQREQIEGYCKLYGLELIDVIVDAGESAKSLDRPGLTQALAALRSGKADALIVAKLDRLTRNVRDLGDLIESYFRRSALLSVGEQFDTRSASGRMVLNMLTTIAQWEREIIGERTAAALAHKASRGEYVGGKPPFGFRVGPDGVNLVEHEGEQAVLTQARKLRAAGLSLRAVARELHDAGLSGRTGKAFAFQQIQRMVA